MKVRTAQLEDIDAIVQVESAAFGYQQDSARCQRLREKLSRSIEQWLVLPIEGQIIGALCIRRDRLGFGKSVLLKGDVGEVAIHPSFQGRGHGSELMEGAVQWMHQQRYDLSRLGGLVRFYARFGYLRFPRRYVELSIGRTVRAGASQVCEGEIPIPAHRAAQIRALDPATDRTALRQLVQDFRRPYYGSPVEVSDELFTAGPLCLVFQEQGRPVGYLRAQEYPHEVTEFEARITIREIAYRKDRPDVIQSLIAHVANYAVRQGIGRITARIPFDPEILAALRELPIGLQTIETHGGQASNMLQIVHLASLFERLGPELEHRLSRSGSRTWSGVLEVAIEKGSVWLLIVDGTVRLADARAPRLVLKVSEHDLLQLVLGLLSYEELPNGPSLPGEAEADLLRALFPRKLVCPDGWG